MAQMQNNPDRINISKAFFDGRDKKLTVNGWCLTSSGVVRIEISSQVHGLLGTAVHGLHRPDIYKRFPDYADQAAGWMFETSLPDMSSDDQVTALLVTGEGVRREFKMMPVIVNGAGPAERLTLKSFYYDTESKFLCIEGEVYPTEPVRLLRTEFAGGRTEPVETMFRPSGNLTFKTGGSVNRFGGFRTKIKNLGQGALAEINILADHIDGGVTTWRLDTGKLVFDPPEAEITKVVVDYVNGTIAADGWYRAYETVTTLDFRIGDDVLEAIPVVREDPDLARSLGFKGPVVRRVAYRAQIAEALSEDRLWLNAPVVMTLKSRGKALYSVEAASSLVVHDLAHVTFAVFDKRRSLLMMWGTCTPEHPIAALNVFVGGRNLGKNLLPILADVDQTAECRFWFFAEEINIELTPSHKLEVEAMFEGVPGAVKLNDVPVPVVVRARHAIEGMPPEKIVERLTFHNMTPRRIQAPSVCFVFQGSVTAQGGGVSRMCNMMRAFKRAGYSVFLIDRTHPSYFFDSCDSYKALRRYCNEHFMAPRQFNAAMLASLQSELSTVSNPTPAQRRLINFINAGNTKDNQIDPVLGLKNRIDRNFNAIAAGILENLKPDVVISQFCWSSELHSVLPDGAVGLLDTHDIQHLRYKSFKEATEKYGENAVPDLHKFEANEEEEKRLLNQAGACIAITPEEKVELDKMVGERNVVLAMLSHDGSDFIGSPPQSRSILFVGNHYAANNFGIRNFLEEIWPRVLERVPDAIIDIVGRCGETVEDLADDSVRVHHVVDDIAPLYEGAAMTINPVRFGTGLPVKMIEGFAIGKACVSTTCGARGLSTAIDMGAVVVADAPDDFADQTARLLLDPQARRKVEESAYAYARNNLGFDVVYSNLFNFLESRLFYAPR